MKIGLLVPGSNYLPTVGKDIVACVKHGLADELDVVALTIEPGGYNAAKQLVLDKIQSMVLKDDIDLVLAPLNVGLFPELDAMLKSNDIPIIANWLGEDVYFDEHKSDYIFSNSIDQWQSSWMAGRYAGEHFGKTAATFSSIHDGGYGVALAYAIGFEGAGGAPKYTGVTHRTARDEDSTESIKEGMSDGVDTVYALYSGKEAVSFLRDYWALGHSNETLITNYFMVEDDVLESVGKQAIGIKTISNWDKDDDSNPLNVEFNQWFKDKLKKPSHIYGLLAYETGLILADVIRSGVDISDTNAFFKALADTRVDGPRGMVNLSRGEDIIRKEYLLEVAEREDGSLYRKRIKELEVPELYTEQLALAKKNLQKNGWLNPYLIA